MMLAHGIKSLHLYTLNMATSALAILMNLGMIDASKISRSLPWRRPANVFRTKEDVLPIFWANRPKSYISRTKGWEDFPQGRWGDSRSASYGALSDHQFSRPRARDKKLQQEWAVPLRSVEDIQEMTNHEGGAPYKVALSSYEDVLVPVGFKAVSVEENPDSIPTRKGKEQLARWKKIN